MQGPGSSVTTLPENIIFDNGSTSSDAGVDSQMPWNNNIQISAQNRLPDYIIPSSETTHNQYLQHSRHDMRNGEWCLGETSSRATLDLEQRQYGPYNILSSDRVEINPVRNQITSGSFLLPNSSSNAVPQDLNMSLEFEDQDDDDDDCQVIEPPGSRVSAGSANEQIRSNSGGPAVSYGGPACGGYVMDESEDRPRMSCKRKTLEGQSSGVGTSNCFQTALPENNISMPIQAASHIVINNGPEQANPRLGLGVGRPVSSSPFSATAPGIPESSRRNFRLRINGLHHHQDPITTENPFLSDPTDVGNVDVSSSQHSSRLVLRNRMLDLNPVENGSPQGQSALLDVPSVRRIHQSRWTGSSSSRRSSRSSSAIASISEEGPAQRTFPRRISEHPMFVPASETRNSSQNPTNWNLSGVGNINNNIAGNIPYTSRVGSSRGESLSAPSWPHRSFPQYPRRLSEIVRRSLLSSPAGNGSGDRSVINHVEPLGSSASAQDNHGRHVPISRSTLLERHLDGASGVPYSWRTLAGASEGRSSLMSEQIRHVLDLMRRGEGLRFEDVMILDHSVLFGMADIHDRHRDMRLDVDNMSYEELLALEERIGNVCTGLTEETILSHLKQRLYVDSKLEDQVETEPCSICREEYIDGEDLGSLECGHDFHKECIKQWLMHKNLCPICKTTGLTT